MDTDITLELNLELEMNGEYKNIENIHRTLCSQWDTRLYVIIESEL